MAKKDYIHPADPGFSTQILTFKNGVGPYAAGLGITTEQLTGQAADADYFAYTVETNTVIQNAARQWSVWKQLMRDGGAPAIPGAPADVDLPAAVPVVATGIEERFRALVRTVKTSAAYNPATGHALGIEGDEQADPDLGTIAPILVVRIVGGQVVVEWGWQGFGAKLDLIEIQVDRGTGYSLLTYDTTPGYTDTTPLPAIPATWTYKAIYRKGDDRVGQWCAPVSITVGG